MIRRAVAAMALLALAAPAVAKVVTAETGGFAAGDSVVIAAPPALVWETLVTPARWWDPAHSWSHDAANLTIAPHAGGCFCEQLADGAVEHLHVVWWQPGKRLRMRGALGPLQQEGVDGALSFVLTPAAGGTTLAWSYHIGGYLPGGGVKWAPLVDGMLSAQVARLKAAAERPAAR